MDMAVVKATATVASSGMKLSSGIAAWLRDVHGRRRTARYARALLGVADGELYSYRMSMDHPAAHGIPHRDDLAAFADLAGPDIAWAQQKGWLDYADDIHTDFDHGMVLIGSPESEAITRLVFGYERLPDVAGTHFAGGTLDLPYRWLEETDQVHAECRRYKPDEGLVSRPNWPIVDNTGFRPTQHYPVLTNAGLLRTDYLLVTRIPNYLTVEAEHAGRSIVSVAGTHGVATRGIGLLLRDRRQMARILETTGGSTQAFQVLAEVSKIDHDPVRGSIARRITVRDVRPFEMDEQACSAARQAVQRRFTDWAAELTWRSRRPGNGDPAGSVQV